MKWNAKSNVTSLRPPHLFKLVLDKQPLINMKLFAITFLTLSLSTACTEILGLEHNLAGVCPDTCVSETEARDQCVGLQNKYIVWRCAAGTFKCSSATSTRSTLRQGVRRRPPQFTRCGARFVFVRTRCKRRSSGGAIYHAHCMRVSSGGENSQGYEYTNLLGMFSLNVLSFSRRSVVCSPIPVWLAWSHNFKICMLSALGNCRGTTVKDAIRICCPDCHFRRGGVSARSLPPTVL